MSCLFTRVLSKQIGYYMYQAFCTVPCPFKGRQNGPTELKDKRLIHVGNPSLAQVQYTKF